MNRLHQLALKIRQKGFDKEAKYIQKVADNFSKDISMGYSRMNGEEKEHASVAVNTDEVSYVKRFVDVDSAFDMYEQLTPQNIEELFYSSQADVIGKLKNVVAGLISKGQQKEAGQIEKVISMAQQEMLELTNEEELANRKRQQYRKRYDSIFIEGIKKVLNRAADMLKDTGGIHETTRLLSKIKQVQAALQYTVEKVEKEIGISHVESVLRQAQQTDVVIDSVFINQMMNDVKRAKDILNSLSKQNTVTEILGNIQAAKQHLQLVENKAQTKGYTGDYSNIKYTY